eukprot:2680738-Amphidinium_carterae.2
MMPTPSACCLSPARRTQGQRTSNQSKSEPAPSFARLLSDSDNSNMEWSNTSGKESSCTNPCTGSDDPRHEKSETEEKELEHVELCANKEASST